MKAPVDLNRIIRKKGLDPVRPYPGVVVDNNDPDYLYRVRVRCPQIHDHLPDTKLPWATKCQDHYEGLKGGSDSTRSGSCHIPKRGHEVVLYFPSGGDPMIPEYRNNRPMDKANRMPEFEKNYPFRYGYKLKNGHFEIIDTKTNEVFFNNPGDWDITILGDVNQTIVGNQTLMVTGDMGDIPGYIRNAPEFVIKDLAPKPAGRIPFKGLLAKKASSHTNIRGDHTMEIDGNVKWIVKKDMTVDVKGNSIYKTGKEHTHNAVKHYAVTSARIDLN